MKTLKRLIRFREKGSAPYTAAIFTGIAGFIMLTGCVRENSRWQISSPGNLIRVEVLKKDLAPSGQLYYAVYIHRDGEFVQIVEPSSLGIIREDGRFVDNLEPVSVEKREEMTDEYTLVSGKKLANRNMYNEMELCFTNPEEQKVCLIFRAYDKGVAFRYAFPGNSNQNFRITRELTGFDFGAGSFWGHPYDTVTTWAPAYETYFTGPMAIGTEAPWNKNGWAFPILLESNGSWMLVSEAGFDGSYGACHLHAECPDGLYTLKFPEQEEALGYYENTSYSNLPWSSPWRFIAVGETLSGILETSLPTDLSAPSQLEDISWIRPGRATWSWWSDSDSPQDYNDIIPFIDFAAQMGWEYSLVDANWNHMKHGDVGQLAKYAAEKNVGLLLWYNSGGIHNLVPEEPRDLLDDRKSRRMEFKRISDMGIRGIKVDFFQSDKQEIIRQYTEILEDAAEFNLLVNFHGCTLPRGWRRTWPNLLTMEAIRGGESYKFDRTFPERVPSHLTIVPYTRNAVGPADYTPGTFSDHQYPHLTTHGFELALPVIIESGIMHYSDTPGQTMELPGFAIDFLREVPVIWDDTRYLAGYPGKDVVIARKSGSRWYIAGINGEDISKELTFNLPDMDGMPDAVRLIRDGESDRSLQMTDLQVMDGKMTVSMKPFGGFAGFWD
ncbi:MAG TPA: glycoside hydrolase family 97 protein [Bacteroides sp.]|nr:glycoside hydrolase family 97 protein [Bacteroides sp.]